MNILDPNTQNLVLLALWTLICLGLGFRMGRSQAVNPEPNVKAPRPNKEPFTFESEGGYVEDEILKEQNDGYRKIGGGRVEERVEDL